MPNEGGGLYEAHDYVDGGALYEAHDPVGCGGVGDGGDHVGHGDAGVRRWRLLERLSNLPREEQVEKEAES